MKDGCPENTFSCNDLKHRCIIHNWVCDGTADCLNGSDEANCTTTKGSRLFGKKVQIYGNFRQPLS